MAASQQILVPLNEAFNEGARIHLEQLSTLAPQFSAELAGLIRICKKSEMPRNNSLVPSPCSARLSSLSAQSPKGNQVFQALEVFLIYCFYKHAYF